MSPATVLGIVVTVSNCAFSVCDTIKLPCFHVLVAILAQPAAVLRESCAFSSRDILAAKLGCVLIQLLFSFFMHSFCFFILLFNLPVFFLVLSVQFIYVFNLHRALLAVVFLLQCVLFLDPR